MNEWHYCAPVIDKRTGKKVMLNLVNNRWQIAHELKQMIDGADLIIEVTSEKIPEAVS